MNQNLSSAQFGNCNGMSETPYFTTPHEPENLTAGQARAVDREFGKPETPGRFTQYGE